jgi:hypothetical protein
LGPAGGDVGRELNDYYWWVMGDGMRVKEKERGKEREKEEKEEIVGIDKVAKYASFG